MPTYDELRAEQMDTYDIPAAAGLIGHPINKQKGRPEPFYYIE